MRRDYFGTVTLNEEQPTEAGPLIPIICIATVPVTWTVWAATRKRNGTTKFRVLASPIPLLNVALVAIGFAGRDAFCGGEFNGC